MSNAIICTIKKFVFKNSGISCLDLIFNLNNLSGKEDNPKMKIQAKMKILHAQNCKAQQIVYHFFSFDLYEPQWLR